MMKVIKSIFYCMKPEAMVIEAMGIIGCEKVTSAYKPSGQGHQASTYLPFQWYEATRSISTSPAPHPSGCDA